ncbi:protein IQ-DOMAIN 3-like [Salvia miltiorrhiza]|uniref:protein IQ-DOMAIN 3-like n=1 Tax=Salvia miltiorrhiza TaxID=226208 RepID=UPI0025AC67CD|nr:protein IQ-DOMAIN 3-like [Salvia miltiorrhiza]XP_057784547.1 protein IQ-DOMAIN 3-like [Salvia miltiorrhiza]
MGKRRSLFSALKKALACESKQNQGKSTRKKRGCFRRQQSVNQEASSAEKAIVLQASPPPTPREEVKLLEAESEQNRHAYSVALVTAMAAEAAVAAANAAAEVVRLRAAAYSSGKTKEEIASIKIQAAFRGYMARRVLRALRGLVRLKSVVGGKSVERQAAASLKCMQTMARLQSEIRARRIRLLEENPSVLKQRPNDDLEKSRALKGDNWDQSSRSKEQIEADKHYRKEAAMRRERALAYAYSHQTFRNPSDSTNEMLVDPSNPGWGWSWLERWMAGRPWEKGDLVEYKACNGLVAVAKASGRAGALRGDTKAQSPTAQGGSRPPSRQSPSTPKSKAGGRIRPPSPRGVISTDDDSRSLNSTQSEQCRRRSSYAGSSLRDDESLASSPAVPGYMAYTESARARSRLPSPQGSETAGSAKKRLSFSGSPVRPKRHSTPTKTGASP